MGFRAVETHTQVRYWVSSDMEEDDPRVRIRGQGMEFPLELSKWFVVDQSASECKLDYQEVRQAKDTERTFESGRSLQESRSAGLLDIHLIFKNVTFVC